MSLERNTLLLNKVSFKKLIHLRKPKPLIIKSSSKSLNLYDITDGDISLDL